MVSNFLPAGALVRGYFVAGGAVFTDSCCGAGSVGAGGLFKVLSLLVVVNIASYGDSAPRSGMRGVGVGISSRVNACRP